MPFDEPSGPMTTIEGHDRQHADGADAGDQVAVAAGPGQVDDDDEHAPAAPSADDRQQGQDRVGVEGDHLALTSRQPSRRRTARDRRQERLSPAA